MKKIQIGIMGSAADLNYSDEALAFAKELGKLIVPFTIIFSNADVADKFEAGIFHNIPDVQTWNRKRKQYPLYRRQ